MENDNDKQIIIGYNNTTISIDIDLVKDISAEYVKSINIYYTNKKKLKLTFDTKEEKNEVFNKLKKQVSSWF